MINSVSNDMDMKLDAKHSDIILKLKENKNEIVKQVQDITQEQDEEFDKVEQNMNDVKKSLVNKIEGLRGELMELTRLMKTQYKKTKRQIDDIWENAVNVQQN